MISVDSQFHSRISVAETRIDRIEKDVEELKGLARSVMKAALLGAVTGGSAIAALSHFISKVVG